MKPLFAVNFVEQRFQRFSFEKMTQRVPPQQAGLRLAQGTFDGA